MSLSAKTPGVLLGWKTNGKRGTRRIKQSAKRFQKRLARRNYDDTTKNAGINR